VDSSRTLSADINRETLDELLAAKALFAAAMHAAADALVQIDERRRIVRFSTTAQALLGYSAESLIGSPFDSLLLGGSMPELRADSAEVQLHALTLRDSAGKPVAVRARSVALIHASQIDGWLVAFTPKARVEEIEQLKNELVSTVSHELKTPLAAIKAYTATLRQNPRLYESRRDEFLLVVEQQADRLSRLVDDMLLVARVESGQMLRRRVNVPLGELVDEALRYLQHDPVRHPLACRERDMTISGDPERLRDIFRNLLENAFKYSPAGGAVEIAGETVGDHSEVTVRDSGIGIAAADLPYIFDRFYRVESENTASVGGSGLGLYIVHALVRAHGGTIDVSSELGEGTTFTLRLPLR
jgi:two-component system phosphate regulon sensor histidine kinase PhoR